MKPKTILKPSVITQTKWYKIINQPVVMPDETRVDWQVLIDGWAVSGAIVDKDNNIYLVKEWRGAWLSEITSVVTGGVRANLTISQARQEFVRESQEEVGLRPKQVSFLGKFKHGANQKGYRYIFLGQDPVRDPLPKDKGEYLEVVKIPFDEAVKHYIYQNKDNLTTHSALALLLAQQKLKQS